MSESTLGQIKSFVIRTSRMSPAQKRGWERYGDRFIVPFNGDTVVSQTAFFPEGDPGRAVKLDIGFGMGRELATLAENEPETDFIGVEVHRPGVGRLLLDLGERNLDNVRIVPHDAVEVCRFMLAAESVDAVHLFFPDPWPKARHAKRRLVRSGFPELISRVLKPTGYLYMVTDWEEYAIQMREIMESTALFQNRYTREHRFAPPQSWRPQTAFERKGLAKGHRIYELIYDRLSGV
ncbi:MAG: tRNA (guanosine(46)-N7)-methyltransferase TrmB [Spirochaeta sp.]|jgi:tRNA (guanine-N7-)-methyltransferase|nr:tRNA (guanosine(46)-N7)-methyltransferase TrmB [Spirochaeta sp.]